MLNMAQSANEDSKTEDNQNINEFVSAYTLSKSIEQKLRSDGTNIAELCGKSEDEIDEFVKVLLEDEQEQNELKIAIMTKKSKDQIMTIYVKALTGQNRTFEVTKDTTVLELKKSIEAKDGIAVKQQKLLYSDQELNDNKLTMKDYNIEQEAEIYLLCTNKNGCIVM